MHTVYCAICKATREFEALAQIGSMESETEQGAPAELRMANCECGSTLAILIPL